MRMFGATEEVCEIVTDSPRVSTSHFPTDALRPKHSSSVKGPLWPAKLRGKQHAQSSSWDPPGHLLVDRLGANLGRALTCLRQVANYILLVWAVGFSWKLVVSLFPFFLFVLGGGDRCCTILTCLVVLWSDGDVHWGRGGCCSKYACVCVGACWIGMVVAYPGARTMVVVGSESRPGRRRERGRGASRRHVRGFAWIFKIC